MAYISSVYHNQKFVTYGDLKRCINIAILDFNLKEDNAFHSVYMNTCRLNYMEPITWDIITIHTLELLKVNKEATDKLSLWARFLRANSFEEKTKLNLIDEDIDKSYEVLKENNNVTS